MRRSKRVFFFLSAVVALVGIPAAVDAAVAIQKAAPVSQVLLKKKKSIIRAKGKRPVVIKDKARVTKSFDLRGALFNKKGDVTVRSSLVPKTDNTYDLGSTTAAWATAYVNDIVLPDGGTVDGVDVSALNTTVEGLSAQDTLPTTCSENQIPQYNGDSWECGSDADTTYTAGDGLTLSSGEFSMEGTSYDNVIIVAKSGGDYTTITEAMNSITDAASGNEYYVWVAPGTYVEQVTMKDYVTLEGAGPERVLIGYLSTDATTGAINAANDSEIRNLSVAGYGTTTSMNIYIGSGASAVIDNVDISLPDPTGTAYGVYNAGSATLSHLDFSIGDATTAGYAVYSTASVKILDSELSVNDAAISQPVAINAASTAEVTIRDSVLEVLGDSSTSQTDCTVYDQTGASVTATIANSYLDGTGTDPAGCPGAHYGVQINSGTLEIHNSQILADDEGIDHNGGTVNVAGSQIDATATETGTVTCINSYDASFSSATCN